MASFRFHASPGLPVRNEAPVVASRDYTNVLVKSNIAYSKQQLWHLICHYEQQGGIYTFFCPDRYIVTVEMAMSSWMWLVIPCD
jgi:hypothetical protein